MYKNFITTVANRLYNKRVGTDNNSNTLNIANIFHSLQNKCPRLKESFAIVSILKARANPENKSHRYTKQFFSNFNITLFKNFLTLYYQCLHITF